MAGHGPLPKPTRRRTNKPAIPTRRLPAGGFAGPYPRPPAWVKLGKEGAAWWRWAWRTPQAAAWSDGDLAAIARRAELEDDKAALAQVEGLDVSSALGLLRSGEELKAVLELRWLVGALAALSAGKLAIYAKMLDLDRQLGLTTKASLDLRNEIVDTPKTEEQKETEEDAQPARWGDLRVVDGA